MAATLRSEVARAGFRVSTIRTQTALVEQHTIRERLLAELALFFGVVVLTLAGIGLYGVLEYSVLQQQREIGIRIAVGAQAGDIAKEVILKVFTVVMAGLLCGIVLGIASARFIGSLLFEVKVTEARILAVPTAGILGVAMLAALFPVLRAIRTDPVAILRSE
jgi:ABC-type antimicrobial peptide transport system permease subunit